MQGAIQVLGFTFYLFKWPDNMAVEMGRSSADAEVRPKNSAECSARQHVTIRPNFGKHSASFMASHLRLFALATGLTKVNKVNILTISY